MKGLTLIRAELVALLLTFSSTSGQTQFLSGNDVHSWCQSNRPMALAYTAGLADEAAHSVVVLDSLRPSDSKGFDATLALSLNASVDLGTKLIGGFCRPSDVTLNQVTDVLCAYLRDTPQDRNGFPPIIFSTAMQKAWPCKAP
jgi:hypothetical protein